MGGGGEISCPSFLNMGGFKFGVGGDTGLCGRGGVVRNKQGVCDV